MKDGRHIEKLWIKTKVIPCIVSLGITAPT